MHSAKRITTYLSVAIISASLLAGYFCFAPQMAQAAPNMSYASYPSYSSSDCQDAMVEFDSPIIASSANSNSIAPCCLAKKDNPQSSAIILNAFSLDSSSPQASSAEKITVDNSAKLAASFDYPISPTQTGFSSSLALIE